MKDIYCFFTTKEVVIIEKNDVHAYKTSILNYNSIIAIIVRHKV